MYKKSQDDEEEKERDCAPASKTQGCCTDDGCSTERWRDVGKEDDVCEAVEGRGGTSKRDRI